MTISVAACVRVEGPFDSDMTNAADAAERRGETTLHDVLTPAILAEELVRAHDLLGRNRPRAASG